VAGRHTDSPLFLEQVPGSLRLAGWLVLLLALMLADLRQGWLGQLRTATGPLFEPVFTTLNLPARLWQQMELWTRRQQDLVAINRRLQDENLHLHARVQQLQSRLVEQAVIRDLLQPVQEALDQALVARVQRLRLHPLGSRVLVDRGADDGVREGMAVLTARGVAGQVVTVLPAHAWVMLISDPDHALPVRVARTGVHSIVVGRGDPGLLEAINLPLSVDLKPGDLLESSGLGGRFPPGYPVARVISVERVTGERFARVQARPLARLDRLDFMLLGHWPVPP